MRIAICDDCMEDALALKRLLGGHEVRVYSDAGTLLANIKNEDIRYDLYLLDIFIEESVNGIELAKELRGIQENAVICFISTSNDFYREAYDIYAVQYLLKPVREEAVRQLLARVSAAMERNGRRKLVFQWKGQSGSIPYGKILYITSREHTLFIYCTDGTIQECRGKISELAAQVDGNVFLRCHQSFLVNMYRVDSINGNELTVGGKRIPISRPYYAGVKSRYREILFEEVE